MPRRSTGQVTDAYDAAVEKVLRAGAGHVSRRPSAARPPPVRRRRVTFTLLPGDGWAAATARATAPAATTATPTRVIPTGTALPTATPQSGVSKTPAGLSATPRRSAAPAPPAVVPTKSHQTHTPIRRDANGFALGGPRHPVAQPTTSTQATLTVCGTCEKSVPGPNIRTLTGRLAQRTTFPSAGTYSICSLSVACVTEERRSRGPMVGRMGSATRPPGSHAIAPALRPVQLPFRRGRAARSAARGDAPPPA
jgi:hypothetical protein